MYCKILAALSLFIATVARSQSVAPSIQWQHAMGGTFDDISYDVVQTSDGGFIITGGSTSSDGDLLKSAEPEHGGNYDYWFAKLDPASNFQWKKHIGGTGSDLSTRVFQTSDGGYLVGGASNSNDVDVSGNHGDYDFWIVKLFSSGTVQWSKCYGGSDYEDFGSVRPTSEGGYILCGGSKSNDMEVSGNHGNSDFWLVKTDGAGSIQWQKSFGGSGYDKASDVRQCPDGGYVIVGFSESIDGDVTGNHGDYDGWVVKTDGNGVLQWQTSIGGSKDDNADGVLTLSDGTIIVSGYTFSNDGDVSGNHGDYDAWLLKLSNGGSVLWSKCFGGSGTDQASSVEALADTGFVIACLSKSNDGDATSNYGLWDFWALTTDLEGSLIWQKNFGGSSNDVCYAAKSTYDGGFILCGYTSSLDFDVTGNHGQKDYWAVRLQGTVGIDDPYVSEQPMLIYPQPADESFMMEMPDAHINSIHGLDLTIFDTKGRIEMNLSDLRGQLLKLDCSKWLPGMYFYRLNDEKSVVSTGKILIQ